MNSNPPAAESSNILGIVAAIATITAVGTGLSISIPLLAIILEMRGTPGAITGLNSAMAGIASMLVAPLVPMLLARMPASKLAFITIAIAAISLFGFWLFDSITIWFVLRLIYHGALGAAFIVSEFWIVALAPDHRRGLVMGIYSTVLCAGFALGPAILSLVGTDGVTPFAIGSAIITIALIPVLIAWRHSPELQERAVPNFLHMLFVLPIATMAAFVFGFVEAGEFAWLSIYGLRSGYSEAMSTGLLTAIGIGGFFFLIPLGMLADRMDKRILILICTIFGVIGMALVPMLTPHFNSLLVLLCIYGGITGAIYTAGLTYLGSRLKADQLASANSVFVFMYSAGIVLGPASLGIAIDIWNPVGVPYLLAIVMAGFAIFVAYRIISGKSGKSVPNA